MCEHCKEVKLVERKTIVKGSMEKPFKLYFTYLGDWSNLEYDFKTEKEARKMLEELIEEFKRMKSIHKNYDGYYADISKKIIVKSEEIE